MSLKQVLCTFVIVVIVAVAAGADDVPLKITVNARTVEVTNAGKPVLRYRYEEVPFKPYVDELRTPSGVNILRDAPHDHLHHHGLMFAVGVDGVNFWEEARTPGRQRHMSLTETSVGRVLGTDYAHFTERIDWIHPPDSKVLLHEERRIGIWRPAGFEPTILLWQSKFTLPKKKDSATWSGERYYGLGARFLQAMDPTARFFNADGKTGVDGTNAVKSKWCAMTATADGKPVTYAMFDQEGNKPPITWFTMTDHFAYLAATPALDKEPIEIRANKPLLFAYLVAVWDGHKNPEDIAKFCQQWNDLKQTAEGE